MAKRRGTFMHISLRLVALCFIIGGIFLLWVASFKIPSFDTLSGGRQVPQSTKIYDRTGEVLLYDIHNEIQRTIVPFEDISRNIKNATVAIEDAEFYEHGGIRPLATFRAVFIQPLRGKGIQGGSTITQQVVKNSLLTNERKISRKLKEWVLAWKLDKEFPKEKILELYLNESPYGGNLYGVQEASMAFFSKPASDVTLAEAAYLAALPKAPTYYSPYGNHQDELVDRKNLVLKRMKDLSFITQEEFDEAYKENVVFNQQKEQGILAPHFVIYVRSYLEEKYGRDAVLNEGLKVITTLDYELQKKAEDIVKTFALENEQNFNAENAGLVAVDPKTGQILTMVGSRDYFDDNIDGNFNIALAKRQPGSAFKPFVYATAFKNGYTPDTVVFDVETQFETACTPEGKPIIETEDDNICYTPVNYDGIYRGPVTLRNALAQSINVPAIKTLYLAGLRDSLRTAEDLGISTLTDINRYGLTLVLGGGEVTLLDITSAYGVFANDGMRNNPVAILSVESINKGVLESFSPNPERVLAENVARQISDILSDNVARTPAFGSFSPLYFPSSDVAAKTGTTNDYRDAWTVGYSPNIAVGAWAGNNDNSSMEKKVAGFIVTPLWNAFMKEVLAKQTGESFKKPVYEYKNDSSVKPIIRGIWQGGETYTIDAISGKLATDYTPEETRVELAIQNIHSILYWVNKKNPLGPPLERPENDPQFLLWEKPVLEWAELNGFSSTTQRSVPVEYDSVHMPETIPRVSIASPAHNVVYVPNQKISVSLILQSTYPISRIDYFVNGEFLGSAGVVPFSFSFVPSDIKAINGTNTLTAVVYDSVKNKVVTSGIFTVGL
ncbi:MAG: hypothetical protein COW88_01890 [Candidatus Lloydbacteria bacterium CG22_combo_CG10-13_8_21_14_all_47_15]|uniref:Uncharacterized protein n=1 Tax=Candidatus Lloydbacteria bacterium CG22_combo_CG10-13_8_21_14_all_47_15 TaxID=1974635 RepID=A0A2H0CVK6_9BACT|nr:MAG: hypothetical protein COW88_01890 [Candidatus Lloydbacteria bacterium CG22_combo_CG10-13_8_21_14_all_47_15]